MLEYQESIYNKYLGAYLANSQNVLLYTYRECPVLLLRLVMIVDFITLFTSPW